MIGFQKNSFRLIICPNLIGLSLKNKKSPNKLDKVEKQA